MKHMIGVAVGLWLLAGTGVAVGQEELQQTVTGRQQPSDRASSDSKRSEQPTEVHGTVKKVNVSDRIIVVSTSDGQEQEFHATEQTRFVGRRGVAREREGAREERPHGKRFLEGWLSRLHEGTPVTITLDTEAGANTIKEIQVSRSRSRGGRSEDTGKERGGTTTKRGTDTKHDTERDDK